MTCRKKWNQIARNACVRTGVPPAWSRKREDEEETGSALRVSPGEKTVTLRCGCEVPWREWGGPGQEDYPWIGHYAYCPIHGDTEISDLDPRDYNIITEEDTAPEGDRGRQTDAGESGMAYAEGAVLHLFARPDTDGRIHWWYCFSGGGEDGLAFETDDVGPFDSKEEALSDAQSSLSTVEGDSAWHSRPDCPGDGHSPQGPLPIRAQREIGTDGWALLARAIVGGMYLDPAEEPATYSPDFPAAAEAAMKTLSPQEKVVLETRLGLLDGHFRTFQEVGRAMGWKREKVRQVMARALRKLRHPRFGLTKMIHIPDGREEEYL